MAKDYCVPWRLIPNKIVRYPGGREIDRFRGIFPGEDDGRPEAWIGSDTATVDAASTGDPNNGRARCIMPGGEEVYLFEAVKANPELTLGPDHRKENGDNLGVLVKLLDAQQQLGLQTHPTREYAGKHFGSPYGKEESWYIIGLREDSEEPPYVLLGFKEGVTREVFEEAFDRGDIRAMEQCCHKIPARVGDAFFIQAGAPHAVGCGCFLVEVQEPSDITVGAHKLRQGDPEEQAAYKERLLGCYIYNGSDYEENLRRYRIPPTVLREGPWGKECLVIGPAQTLYFSFTRLDLTGEAPLSRTGRPQIGIVLEGEGVLRCNGTELAVKQGDELFFPYSVDPVSACPGDRGLSLALCNPAGAALGGLE